MSVFNPQYFYRRYPGPVQSTVLVCRNRVVVRNKNQTIGMVQINRQPAGSFSLRELMTTLRRAFGWPEVFKCRSSPQRIHTSTNLFRTQFAVDFYELLALIEGLCQLFVFKRYVHRLLKSRSF